MANRSGKRAKKPLQTTLGKASCQNEKEVDLSHVRKPIHTSIFGLQQVLSLFQTSTEEVQNYIKYECDIMYECRTCRTIFRSLANFILHKRSYCRERFNPLGLLNNNEDVQENGCSENLQHPDLDSRPVTPELINYTTKEVKKKLSPIIEKLKVKQEIQQLAQEALNEDLSSKELVQEGNTAVKRADINHDLLLEEIATNNAAVFQTIVENLPKMDPGKPEFMKSEVMEIHGILDSDEAVLGADGKICNYQTNKMNANPIIPKGEVLCTECSSRFSTKKTLSYHIKYKHNNTRLVFVCPDCKDTFSNAWCVYRHLYKIHRRTSAQIKRMREQVHNSCIRKDQETHKKREKKQLDKPDKTDEENQWLNDIEGDNDFQMCGGCGKRFERKAALHSHAQMCIKRIAVCNTIKENSAKKKEEDNKNKSQKLEKSCSSDIVKGSSKRKPYLLRTYKPTQKSFTEKLKPIVTEEIETDCDVNANRGTVKSGCDSSETEIVVKNEINILDANNSSLNTSGQDGKHMSVAIEKMDPEKLLRIMGTNASRENAVITEEDKLIDNNFKEKATQDSINSCTHAASAFDLFCQNIAAKLAQKDTKKSGESMCENVPKSLPPILHRRYSSKSDKGVCLLDQNNTKYPFNNDESKEINNDIEIECNNDSKLSDYDNSCLENVPSTSSYKICVKSLDDLVGVSAKVKSDNAIPDVLDTNDPNFLNLSDTIRANISPLKLRKKLSDSHKRKRVASGDYIRSQKFFKSTEAKSSQDVSFVSRASPYMDQAKRLCKPCQTTFPTLTKLLWHMSAHFSWFRFQCSRCSFISFNKWDCASHARQKHKVMKNSIASTVLPIPNWKSVLMAHDFCILKDENELSGKHTDEVISGSLEELTVVKEKDDEIVDTTINNLFEDSKNIDSEPEISLEICGNAPVCIKDESIDIVGENQDSFQVEVPQEIYTLDVSEIIKGVGNDDNRERLRLGSPIKITKIFDNAEIENNFYLLQQNGESDSHKRIKEEIVDENLCNEDKEDINNFNNQLDIGDHKDEDSNSDTDENLKKATHSKMYIRPIRNRTRSIKTIQEDFFYDLSKVIKLNDSSISKVPTLPKQKKSSAGNSQKSARDSGSPNSKSETKSMRVYSKKKY